MSAPASRWVFVAIAASAIAAGTGLWMGNRHAAIQPTAADIAPSAVQAATFADIRGGAHSLGQFQGKVVVLNFWATWCAPCRAEMPAFVRLQDRWGGRNVQFVGLSNEDPGKVDRFGRDLAINYPLWVGGDGVGELSRRLGNRMGVLPFTVLLDGQGRVLESRVGPYSEDLLETKLIAIARNTR